ncbi:hypothetical protein [Chondrinema litorale]|uniref:hypothetical protein n=1 Tax=Chondrinema litorale TaxID=2994555 RepID=UPI00254362C0|nr:hypothetical protein [Chondrinema litorale]UZR95809.1 hypothetical protein OQ292_08285 [Chondrinema litorale]
MSDNYQHIDSIFKEKLGDYKEKPSAAAWDKLDKHLKSNDNNNKGGKNHWGKYGLFSIIVLSFLFVFSGHSTVENTPPDNKEIIEVKPSIKQPLEIEEDKPESIIESEKTELEDTLEETKSTENIVNTNNQTSLKNTTVNIQNQQAELSGTNKEIENSELEIPEEITLEKKGLTKIEKKKAKGKGVKVEITLTPSDNTRQEAAPQQKNPIKTLFRKLRKYTSEENQN